MRAGKRTISSLFICRQQSFQISRVKPFIVLIVRPNIRPLRVRLHIRKFSKCTYEVLFALITRRLEFDKTKPCWNGSLAKINKIIFHYENHWVMCNSPLSNFILHINPQIYPRPWCVFDKQLIQQVKCLTKLKIFHTPLENPISAFRRSNLILRY